MNCTIEIRTNIIPVFSNIEILPLLFKNIMHESSINCETSFECIHKRVIKTMLKPEIIETSNLKARMNLHFQ